MDTAKLNFTVKEAKRFIKFASSLPKVPPYIRGDDGVSLRYYHKQEKAIERASMELTRALVDLRKPQETTNA